jgi:hypothetical protein
MEIFNRSSTLVEEDIATVRVQKQENFGTK